MLTGKPCWVLIARALLYYYFVGALSLSLSSIWHELFLMTTSLGQGATLNRRVIASACPFILNLALKTLKLNM
jgi:hypothetical protein